MAKDKKEPKINPKLKIQNLWEDRINRAKKFREEWEQQFRIKLSRDYFAGKQNPGYPESEWITINKIYSHLMAQLPSLYGVDPYFYIKTKRSFSPKPDDIAAFEQKAKIRQAYLNYLKGELKLKTKARLGVQDTFFAYGVMKTHYVADEVENPDAGKKMEGDLKDVDGNPIMEPDIIPINERYSLTRIHPDDFLFSDDAGPLEDKWPWVAEKIRMPKAKAEKDRRLNQKILDSIQLGESDKDKRRNGTDPEGEKKNKQDEVYVFWEIYDLDNKQWLIIAEGADAPLKEPSSLPNGTEKHPYAVLRFTLQDDSPYPIPPVSQMLDPQKEYCLARSRLMTHRKRFNRKYEAFVQGLTDESELDKLESGVDGTIIRKQTQGPVITAIQDAPLDQQGLLEIGYLNNDLVEISGQSGEARGLADADTATQADILEKRLSMKEGDRLSLVTDWILEIAQKLDQLVQANISKDEAIKITGPQGEFWELVKATDYEEIDGEFEYSVNVGATFPQLPHIERAQWLSFLNLLASFPHLLLQKHLMKRMAEMHHLEDEAMIDELYKLGQQIMSGQLPMPGNAKSQPGQSVEQPGAATGGAALGFLGGLAGGGGAAKRDGTG